MLTRKLLLAAATVLPAAYALPAWAQVSPANANPEHEKLKNEADQAYQKRDFQRAADLAGQVIRENPKDDVAYYLRGSAKVEMGLQQRNAQLVREGVADARQAIALGGREHVDYYLPYLFGMTNLSGLEDKPDHARVALQVATQIVDLPELGNQQKANIYYQRGRAHATLTDWVQAAADFENALKQNPNHLAARLAAGQVYVRTNELDKAESHYDKAIETFPNDPRVYNDRGTFFQRIGKHDAAIADFTKVLELDENAYYAYMNRGFTQMEKGDPKKAEVDFDRALAIQPKEPRLYSLRGTARLMQDKLADADADYRMVVQLDPNNSVARGDLAFAEFFSGDYAAARASFDAALKGNENLKHLVPWLYWSMVLSGQKAQADQRFASVIGDKDEAAWTWPERLLALLMDRTTGDQVLASIKADDERMKNAQICEAHFFLGQKALQAGQSEVAADHFRKSVDTDLEHLSAYRGAEFALQRLDIAVRGVLRVR